MNSNPAPKGALRDWPRERLNVAAPYRALRDRRHFYRGQSRQEAASVLLDLRSGQILDLMAGIENGTDRLPGFSFAESARVVGGYLDALEQSSREFLQERDRHARRAALIIAALVPIAAMVAIWVETELPNLLAQ